MDALPQNQAAQGKAGPSKPRGKPRARSKSLAELPAENLPPPPSALPTVLRKIPRPPNAFILYRSHKMRELKERKNNGTLADAGLDKLDYQRQLSKVIGQLWRDESAQVRATFYEKAQQAAREHADRYPEYRTKPSGTKKSETKTTTSSLSDRMSEKQQHDDFSPSNLSGPVSGSGSGSGRKRASLDGARTKASPYSITRHRRGTSTAPASPTLRHAGHDVTHEHSSVLLRMPYDSQAASFSTSLLYGSLDPAASSSKRTAKSPMRRSLDGHTPHDDSTGNTFDTLVPEHLRERRVFLAPLVTPSLPIGQAITTDEPTFVEPSQLYPGHTKPKANLFDAVKSALPPERRAFLQSSLAMRGLTAGLNLNSPSSAPLCRSTNDKPASSHPTSSQSTDTPEQTESWTSATSSTFEAGNRYDPYSEAASTCLTSQTSYSMEQSTSQTSNIAPDDYYDYSSQSGSYPQGAPSVNLHMSPSAAENYGELSNWTPSNPCWLDYSQLQQTMTGGFDPQSTYAQPLTRFTTIEAGAPPSAYHNVDPSSSAFVALSDPNETGHVQGNFYDFEGQLVAQGSVNSGTCDNVDEETRQRRALDQLLMQMLESNPWPMQQPDLIEPCGIASVQSITADPIHQTTFQPPPLTFAPLKSDEAGPSTSQEKVHQTLRMWKANQLNTIKDKLTRIKHRHSPSTSSLPGPQ